MPAETQHCVFQAMSADEVQPGVQKAANSALRTLGGMAAGGALGSALGAGSHMADNLGAYADNPQHGLKWDLLQDPAEDHNGAFKPVQYERFRHDSTAGHPDPGITGTILSGHGGGDQSTYSVGGHNMWGYLQQHQNELQGLDMVGVAACNHDGCDVPGLLHHNLGYTPSRVVYTEPGHYGTLGVLSQAIRHNLDTPRPWFTPVDESFQYTLDTPPTGVSGKPDIAVAHSVIAPIVPVEAQDGAVVGAGVGGLVAHNWRPQGTREPGQPVPEPETPKPQGPGWLEGLVGAVRPTPKFAAAAKDFAPLTDGGRAEAHPDAPVSPAAVAEGTEHEMEHTDSSPVARAIAVDHVVEIPDYYKRLEKLEDRAKADGMKRAGMMAAPRGDELHLPLTLNPYAGDPTQSAEYENGYSYAQARGHVTLNQTTDGDVQRWSHSNEAWRAGFAEACRKLGVGRVGDAVDPAKVSTWQKPEVPMTTIAPFDPSKLAMGAGLSALLGAGVGAAAGGVAGHMGGENQHQRLEDYQQGLLDVAATGGEAPVFHPSPLDPYIDTARGLGADIDHSNPAIDDMVRDTSANHAALGGAVAGAGAGGVLGLGAGLMGNRKVAAFTFDADSDIRGSALAVLVVKHAAIRATSGVRALLGHMATSTAH